MAEGKITARYICQICFAFIEDNKKKTLCRNCETSLKANK